MLKQIQDALRQVDFDAVLITSPQNRRYATGFPSSAGVCMIDAKGGYLFTDFRYIEAAKKRIGKGFLWIWYAGPMRIWSMQPAGRMGSKPLPMRKDL